MNAFVGEITPSPTIAALQRTDQMDAFIKMLMQKRPGMEFQQKSAVEEETYPEHSSLAPDQEYIPPATPATAPQAEAAAAPEPKQERSAFSRAFVAARDGVLGGFGAMGGLLVGNIFNKNSTSIPDYLKVGAVNFVSNAVQSFATDGEQGGVLEGLASGLATSAIDKLSGDKEISIPEATIGAAAGVLGGWLKTKAKNFFSSFGKDAPTAAPAARLPAPG